MRKRILVADDGANIREIISELLKEAGHRGGGGCRWNGRWGKECRWPYDLYVLDVFYARLDGWI
jgi:CheY-like chemotaxis protein